VGGPPSASSLWGGVVPDSSGPDEVPGVTAAQAAAEAATGAWQSAAAGQPGVGAQVVLPDVPYGCGGYQVLPPAGEGLSVPPPAQPGQIAADHGVIGGAGRPGYAGPAAGDEDPFIGGQ
jgi:hypothetical protein